MPEDLWTALVHVKPKSRNHALSKGAKGAYSNAIGRARNAREFEERVRKAAQELGLEVIQFEDLETLDERIKHADVSKSLWDLAESIQDTEQVYFDAFYNYSADDGVQ